MLKYYKNQSWEIAYQYFDKKKTTIFLVILFCMNFVQMKEWNPMASAA